MRFIDALFSEKIVFEEIWRDMVRPHNTGNPVDLFTVDGETWIGLWSGGIYGGAYQKIEAPGNPQTLPGGWVPGRLSNRRGVWKRWK